MPLQSLASFASHALELALLLACMRVVYALAYRYTLPRARAEYGSAWHAAQSARDAGHLAVAWMCIVGLGLMALT